MKKLYKEIEFEIIRFAAEDIILTSEENWTPGGQVPDINDPDNPIDWNN